MSNHVHLLIQPHKSLSAVTRAVKKTRARQQVTEPKWSSSAFKSPETLNAQLADMLTSRRFTTVVDLGHGIPSTSEHSRASTTRSASFPGVMTLT